MSISENPISGQANHTNAAFLVYVQLDEDGKTDPHPTPAGRKHPKSWLAWMQPGNASSSAGGKNDHTEHFLRKTNQKNVLLTLSAPCANWSTTFR